MSTEIDRPVFVVGVDHSGTSILYRMLAHHPDLAWFSQYSMRDGEIPARVRVPFGGLINRWARRAVGFTWKKQQKWDSLFPQPIEGSAIWGHLIERRDGFIDAAEYSDELAARARSVIHAELRAWHLDRMLVKQPYLTRAIELLDRIFPDAYFLHIVRDGRAVALSNRERFVRRGLGPEEALRESAALWVRTLAYVDRVARALGPHRLMLLRYEDFCEDVHDNVLRTLRFCDLDPSRMPLDELPPTLTPTNSRWLSGCSEVDQRILDDELNLDPGCAGAVLGG